MILLIDNYDSFVHNLARYLQRLGQETRVVRNDATTVHDVRKLQPRAIVISPGPCTPSEAGCSVQVVQELATEIPVLGVCLGHQAIAAAFGAQVIRADEPRHGRTSLITHHSSALFAGLPSPFQACRYHSLIVDESTLPSEMQVTARSDDNRIMAIQHATRPIYGVQFHPESILTEYGYRILANFLAVAGCTASRDPAELATSEYHAETTTAFILPDDPVTF